MKKQTLTLLSFLLFSSALIANEHVEDKVFVRPFVAKVTESMAKHTTKGKHSVANVMAINVGTNIPAGLIVTKEGKNHGLYAYIADIAKKMEKNGAAIITAPASYDVVFTDGTCTYDDTYKQIDAVLAKIGISKDNDAIIKALSELKGVNRATFVQREDSLVLVTDKKALRVGETIFRKSPEGVTQDIYHSEEEYLVAFKNAGLFCEEIVRPSFFGEIKWKAYNDSLKDKKETHNETLGAAYIEHNPVTIYHVVKKAG